MKINIEVNQKTFLVDLEPSDLLVDVLRDKLNLTGTKISCREGECGSCTVWLDGQPINSCIYPAYKAQGCSITIIEGLGDSELPNIVQETMAKFGTPQCGYCTPGFVMVTAALIRGNPNAQHSEIIEGLSGNLCRCTGYTRIIAAVESLVDPNLKIPFSEEG